MGCTKLLSIDATSASQEAVMDQESSVLKPTIIQAGEGPVFEAYGDSMQIKLGGEHTGNKLAIGLETTPPGGGPPPHLHRDEDETFLILEGRYSFLANGEWTELGPGGVVYVPRGEIHTFRNVGDSSSRHWVMTTPSGFEKFFEESATVFAAGPPDMQRILEISSKYGIEFVDAPQNAAE
jgi:quercetin dioxygenase-like cupin family protein